MSASRSLVAVALAFALAAGVGACGGGDDNGEDTKVTTETSGPGTKTGGTAVSFKAALNGTEEVPGPGVKDGVGAALLDVTPSQGCYNLKVTMGEKPVKAHIHKGAKGASGPVVLDLQPTFRPGESAFTAEGCVGPLDEAAQIIADPAGYYVNVHTEAHPDGAIRGQLEKS